MIARRKPRRRRRGAVMLESALVYIVLFLLVLGTIVMGMGIFRYQQVSALAREGSRWASLHGPTYQKEQSKPAPTSQDVLNNVIIPKAAAMKTKSLGCVLTMTSGQAKVAVTYNWTPEAFFKPIVFKSTSVTLINY